jgi:hypothetical protein
MCFQPISIPMSFCCYWVFLLCVCVWCCGWGLACAKQALCHQATAHVVPMSSAQWPQMASGYPFDQHRSKGRVWNWRCPGCRGLRWHAVGCWVCKRGGKTIDGALRNLDSILHAALKSWGVSANPLPSLDNTMTLQWEDWPRDLSSWTTTHFLTTMITTCH